MTRCWARWRACGDNNRNVIAPPTPATNKLGEQVLEHARQVAAAVLPRTRAYHSIWIEGVPLDSEDPANKDFVDPLYGKTYLPRKFKIAFAIPPLNDIDIFTNCCGFIAIGDGSGKLFGYNLTAGGGRPAATAMRRPSRAWRMSSASCRPRGWWTWPGRW